MDTPKLKNMERAYGFDEVALVPGDVTINPDQTNLNFTVGSLNFPIPILASAMDAVVDPDIAIKFNKLGGLAVLNLDGLQARYNKPDEILDEINQQLGYKQYIIGRYYLSVGNKLAALKSAIEMARSMNNDK